MLNRRAFLCGSVATALALPLAAGAQPPAKAARIGVLCGVTFREAFAQGLRELGYVDHRSFVIESRDVAVVDLPRAANDLVRQPVDVVVACTTPEALAAKRATSSIPIVAITEDPVGSGLAASLARPGGNVTGLSLLSSEVGAKRKRRQPWARSSSFSAPACQTNTTTSWRPRSGRMRRPSS